MEKYSAASLAIDHNSQDSPSLEIASLRAGPYE